MPPSVSPLPPPPTAPPLPVPPAGPAALRPRHSQWQPAAEEEEGDAPGDVAEEEKKTETGLNMASGAQVRIEPKGPPADSLELMDWIPEDWKARKCWPNDLRGMGAPTLIAAVSGSAKTGTENWRSQGIGQFVVMFRGQCLFLLWSAKSVLNLGCRLSSMEAWVFRGGLNNRQFHMWADSSCKLVRLDQGDAMWIPYGWFAACLCIPARPGDESAVSFISQPFINKQLASVCPNWDAVSAEQVRLTKAAMAAGSPKLYADRGQQWIEWLEDTADPVECAPAQEAIADAPRPAPAVAPDSGAAAEQIADEAQRDDLD